jgi:subtilisin family serine protease
MQTNLRPLRYLPVLLAAAVILLSVPGGTAPGPQLQKAIHSGREVAAGEVLVKFRGARSAAPTPDEIRLFADTDRDEELGRLGVRRLHSRSLDVEALLAALAQRADVEYAEPNYVVHAIGTVPNDPLFGILWGLQNTGQTIGGQVGTFGADIDASLAWDITKGSRANVVAVVDTGIDYAHQDLQANMWTAPAPFSVTVGGRTIDCAAGTHGFNAIKLTCDPMDDNSHGTHVSGTIGAAGNNGTGVVGVNWIASVMGAKFLDSNGSGTIADAINAIDFAIQAKQVFGAGANVRVLSNSWGGGGFSQAMLNEINKANTSGMLFVAAAGNSGANNDAVAYYPSNYNAPNVVAVAATDNKDQLASFSNYGAATVELGAPGVYIASTVRNNGYAYYSGTSMATPHVSGAAALILSACSLSTDLLRTTILSTVDAVPALAGKTITGGRLNVFGALNGCVAPPAAPTGLSASVLGSQVNLAWTDNSSNEFGFRIERATNGGAWTAIGTVAGKVTTYSDATVAASTQYSYRVFAYNAAGDSVAPTNVVTVGGPLVVQSLTANRTFPVAAGTPITWTTTSSGGVSPVQYEFWVEAPSVGWTLVQGYGASNTLSWTPTAGGTYRVQAWARSAGSSASHDAYSSVVSFTVTGTAALALTPPAANVSFPVAAGTPITWSTAASGGVTPIQYEFWVETPSGGWTLLGGYGPNDSVIWTPIGGGAYRIQAWARNSGSSTVYDAYSSVVSFTVTGTPAPAVTGLAASVTLPAAAGTPMTWTATVTGGTAPLQYAFWLEIPGVGWSLLQGYSTSNTTAPWTPSIAGSYRIQVWVRNDGSTAPYDAYSGLVAFTITAGVSLDGVGPV